MKYTCLELLRCKVNIVQFRKHWHHRIHFTVIYYYRVCPKIFETGLAYCRTQIFAFGISLLNQYIPVARAAQLLKGMLCTPLARA